jgi:manganese-dependent inorganic pyrophosphatase
MNPDTDSIVAAIAYADLASKTGKPAKAVAQGAVTPESDFVLKKFGLAAPEIVKTLPGRNWPGGHHRENPAPRRSGQGRDPGRGRPPQAGRRDHPQSLEMWVWPVGCTCTVLKNMYDFYGVEIPRASPGPCSAPSCPTPSCSSPSPAPPPTRPPARRWQDRGVSDMMALGMEMFKVKSAVDGTPMRDLVFRDYKDFDMGGHGVGIGQLEVVDGDILKPYVDGLLRGNRQAEAGEGPPHHHPDAHRHHEGRQRVLLRFRRQGRLQEGLRRREPASAPSGCPAA